MLEILLTSTFVDSEQSATYAADPIGYIIPFATFTVLFIVWLRIGRDPKLGPPAVRFEPPANLGPAECGFFLDGKIDPRDITAAIINLAVKGYLKIITQNKHGIFAPEDSTLIFTGKKPSDDLTPAEATLYRQFSPESGYVDITSLVVVLGPGITVFASTLKAELRHKGYLRNNADDVIGWTILTGVLLLGTVLALGIRLLPVLAGVPLLPNRHRPKSSDPSLFRLPHAPPNPSRSHRPKPGRRIPQSHGRP